MAADGTKARWWIGGAIAAVLVLGAAALAIDPINLLKMRLIEQDLTTMGWQNGFWGLTNLPSTATIEDLVRARYAREGSFEIVESRQTGLGLGPGIYDVAVVRKTTGPVLIVYRYVGGVWQYREFKP